MLAHLLVVGDLQLHTLLLDLDEAVDLVLLLLHRMVQLLGVGSRQEGVEFGLGRTARLVSIAGAQEPETTGSFGGAMGSGEGFLVSAQSGQTLPHRRELRELGPLAALFRARGLKLLLKARTQILRFLCQGHHEFLDRAIAGFFGQGRPLALDLDARHGLHIADVEALGHEYVLTFAVERIFDLEQLGPPLGLVVLVADFGHIFCNRASVLEEVQLPVMQIVDVDVQDRDDDMQLRVVD